MQYYIFFLGLHFLSHFCPENLIAKTGQGDRSSSKDRLTARSVDVAHLADTIEARYLP